MESSQAELPIRAFTQHHMDSWLHQMRQELVVQARPLLLKPDYDTVPKGLPLPSSSEAEADAKGGESRKSVEGEKENGLDAEDVEILDWGPEGEEAPLLASGGHPLKRLVLILCSLHVRRKQQPSCPRARRKLEDCKPHEPRCQKVLFRRLQSAVPNCYPHSRSFEALAERAASPAGIVQISRSCEELTALLETFLQEACSLHNSSIAYSTLLALGDIAALVISISPVVHHRDFQVCLYAGKTCLVQLEYLLAMSSRHGSCCLSFSRYKHWVYGRCFQAF